jgi:phosphopantetheine adenylyltransferase
MKKSRKDKRKTSDVIIYAKAKMKCVHLIQSSKVEVNQYCNIDHEKENEITRINVPGEMQDGEDYYDAIVASKRGVSIKESN